ncbi:matrixin family metalloprotease [Pyxidicoccus fallax]|uniref:Matrixin family metalloprotease n=1 Tax=Pyxidicoccus fallax TaxID=394095 RepID=A0A848M1E8_9BACT|nr:matrixin family metalloprotease [Pyxidicoccus fallax]NMO23562.1 matrixin family metalloprotease [Pyxidicoccus fallax]NPC86910.1 matrixin family metalloprotease [Pyxidicoccus fallax]
MSLTGNGYTQWLRRGFLVGLSVLSLSCASSEEAPEAPASPPAAEESASAPLKKGDRGPEVERLYTYLKTYGYFPNAALQGFAGWKPAVARTPADPRLFDATLEEALRLFQRAQGLSEDGTLNAATRELMSKPRCAFPDVHATAPRDGKGVSPFFVYSGSRWPGNSVTFSFSNYTGDMSVNDARNAVIGGLRRWSHVARIGFTEVASPGDIQIGWYAGDHGDGYSFDGANGVLAHAFYPTHGDVHFDEAEYWTNNGGGYDLAHVTTHEFGHAIGLNHSADSSAVMYAYYSGRRDLAPDDILGAQYIYGTDAVSLQSYNLQNHYVRHANSLGEISTISSQLDKVDSHFRRVAGLANSGCVSFESVNFPGMFLRHQDYRIKLSPYNGADGLFLADATFCPRPGLANGAWTSFEAYNAPGHYIRHSDFHLSISTGSGEPFLSDATFRVVGALQ